MPIDPPSHRLWIERLSLLQCTQHSAFSARLALKLGRTFRPKVKFFYDCKIATTYGAYNNNLKVVLFRKKALESELNTCTPIHRCVNGS